MHEPVMRMGAEHISYYYENQSRLHCNIHTAKDIVFSTEHDSNVKYCVKQGLSVEECLDRGLTKEVLEQIKEGLATEHGKTEVAEANVTVTCTSALKTAALFQIAAGAIASKTILDLTDIPENMQAAVKQHAERASTIEKLDEGAMELIREFETKASQKVSDSVQFIVEPNSASLLATTINETFVGGLRGDQATYVMCVYDIKLAGEAMTSPNLRTPAFKHERLRKCIAARLQSTSKQSGAEALDDGDMWVVFDGGHAGNKTLILNQFIDCEGKTLVKQVRTVHMFYSEESLTKRLKRQTSINLHQLEAIHMVTQSPLQYTKRSRKFFEGSSNAGNIFGPIATPDPSASWLTTYREKKEMYASFRAPVGGTVEHDENEGRGKRKRQDSDIEPMSFHSTQREVYLELLHSHPPSAVIDFTSCDGGFAMACLEAGMPYLGIAFTEKHKQGLLQHLASNVFNCYTQPDHPWHSVPLSEVLRGCESTTPAAGGDDQGGDSDDQGDDDKPQKPPNGKFKGKAAKKVKVKGKAKATDTDRAELLKRLAEIEGHGESSGSEGNELE